MSAGTVSTYFDTVFCLPVSRILKKLHFYFGMEPIFLITQLKKLTQKGIFFIAAKKYPFV
jgi:hypothetical protein